MSDSFALLTTVIENEADLVSARQRAKLIAELIGFDKQDQTRFATAVSELTRNAVSYAGRGTVDFLVRGEGRNQILIAVIKDSGKGIENLDSILNGQYRSSTGMGLGISGARRLVEHFDIKSGSGGTTVEVGKSLLRLRKRISGPDAANIAAHLARQQQQDPFTALREQNRELLASLAELEQRQQERDRLNQELVDTNRGVVALYAELDERAEQLKLASEAKTRFLANMGHEFRTPLNSILALSRLLLDEVDGRLAPEQHKQITYIRRSADGLLELVNDLLDIAKVESGKTDVRLSEVLVSDLFSGLRGALRPLRTNSDVDLIFEQLPSQLQVFSDEAKLNQILRNFISNALKFTEKGEVRVSVTQDSGGGKTTFSVSDTGIGIAEADLGRIFEEFEQIDSPLQSKTKGTGLGLPLTKKLSDLLGGEVSVTSTLGQGSTFSLTIPTDLRQKTPFAPLRVLLIDDEETFRYVARKTLAADNRIELIEAVDGWDGLRRIREERPDVVILDLQMPVLDGYGVLREVQSDENLRHIPMIISTSLPVNAALRSRLGSIELILPKEEFTREAILKYIWKATRSPETHVH